MVSKIGFLALLLVCVASEPLASWRTHNLQTVYQWQQLAFGFPTESDRQQALDSGNLIPANAIPIDVAPNHTPERGLRTFVTVPRFQKGIPYTLATVSQQNETQGPVLQPYPSYEWHNNDGVSCDLITSVYRVAITECNQMWVLDSGLISGKQICPPQLLLIDLDNDELIHRYRFNTSLYVPIASMFITPVVVVHDPPPSGKCQSVMVYMADCKYHGLVIYNSTLDAAWRAENKYMYPDPKYGTHTIAGETFNLMDGIFGMSSDKEKLYFHPLSSINEYAVPLDVLNNRTNWQNGVGAMSDSFERLGSRRSECAAEAMDSRGNIYCVTFNPINLLTWNINTPYKLRNLREVRVDSKLLEFVSGMKVYSNAETGEEELWMMSNRYQKRSAGTLNFTEINFRVVRRPINDLQR